MPEVIIDGRGTGSTLKVNPDGSINVAGVTVDLSGVSVSAGSTSYIYGQSGGDWYPILVESGTGKIIVDTELVAGSLQTYDPIGVGSVLVTNFPSSIPGSVSQATTPWITTGSFQPYNPIGIGSNLVTNFPTTFPGSVSQSTNPWITLGSTAITNRISGAVAIIDESPLSANKINFAVQLVYSGTVIGSIIKFNPAGGSFVRVLSYTGDNLTNIGSWV